MKKPGFSIPRHFPLNRPSSSRFSPCHPPAKPLKWNETPVRERFRTHPNLSLFVHVFEDTDASVREDAVF
jgi:hypothetical protein